MASSSPGLVAAGMGTVMWGSAGILVKLTEIAGLTLPLYRLALGFGLVLVVVLLLRQRMTWAALLVAAPGACSSPST